MISSYNRAWRWHKKLKIWLTKDELLQPRILSPQHEEGYYIIWNTTDWRKERVSNHMATWQLFQPAKHLH